ncbi:MAG: 30S ribosomal protein S3 [candidate division TM6 bacterium GW2011_GWF2_32_72]|nr:MAG: 30S ribosomal protein S3 [candidate division TM6 bacterium GW2011_GWF2_32_72]
MGQKVNPVGFRLGVYKDWSARWFAKKSYADSVLEDLKIRKFLDQVLSKADIASVEIEKSGDNVKVIVHSGRPGVVIGKKGQEIENLKRDLAKELGRKVIDISVQEVKKPELDATLVAKSIADQLEKRASFKKVMKKASISAMRAGAKGIKICCAGRIGGAEIARSEWIRTGSVPLHTLRSDVDYGTAEAKTTFGVIGVKVWLCRGDFVKIK